VDDYNLTRCWEVDSTVRTPPQSEIGLFWTSIPASNTPAPSTTSSKTTVERNGIGRLMAILWTASRMPHRLLERQVYYNFWVQ